MLPRRTFYFPIVTCLILSIVLSTQFWLRVLQSRYQGIHSRQWAESLWFTRLLASKRPI